MATIATLLMMPLAGCGGGKAPVTAPDETIRQFLEAVRVGDDQKASLLLTETARRKTKEMDLVVSPPGSETASFTVGEMELENSDEAQVASTWTDIGPDGQNHTDAVVWILRLLPEGWRISGMATKVFEDMPPLVLNFEDPQDMIRKQQQTEQEILRRSGVQLPTANAANGPVEGEGQLK
jgi:hypothetical protein